MPRTSDPEDDLDKALAQRFERLRETERVHLPTFPSGQFSGRSPASKRRLPVAGLAVAASLVLAVFLAVDRGAEDPADTYARIMANSGTGTDALLQVSPAILPESGDIDEVLDLYPPSAQAN